MSLDWLALQSRHLIAQFRQFVRSLFILLFISACALVVAPVNASLLYGTVAVSDGATADKSLSIANTSRSLAVGVDGTVYAVYISAADGIRVARSATRGQSFQASVQVSASGASPEIAVSSTGIIYVAWVTGSNAMVSRSLDGGQTFSAPVTAGATTAVSVHMATDAAYIYLIDQQGNNFFRSTDNGLTFSLISINASQVFSDVHVDPDNGAVVLQVDNPTVKYYISTDNGATFGAQTLPNPGGGIYYSVGTLSSGSGGRYLFVSGSGTDALRINLADNSSQSLTFGSNSSNQGRSLSADICGNVVDGYVSGTDVAYHVSHDLGATFDPQVTVATTLSSSVFINKTNGDILFLYQSAGQIYLSVYSGELGNCYNPNVNVSTLVFAAQLVGNTSSAQNAIISNTGAVDVQITGITATGDFAQETNACVGTLAVGASCTIPVTFTPTATGTRTGQLQIQTNVFVDPRIISLTGTGVATSPVATLTPTSIDFGSQALGVASAPQTVTLTNTGNDTLTINGVGFVISGPFAFTGSTCGATLAASATCTVEVTFTPTELGAVSGSLSLNSDSPGAPPSVSLAGEGLNLTSQTITFGAQASRTFVPNGTFTIEPLATATSGLSVIYTTNTPGVCAVTGTTVTMVAPGTCTIAANQAGDDTYTAAEPVVQNVTITQAITNVSSIPTLSEWGIIILSGMLALFGLARVRQTQRAALGQTRGKLG